MKKDRPRSAMIGQVMIGQDKKRQGGIVQGGIRLEMGRTGREEMRGLARARRCDGVGGEGRQAEEKR